MLNWGSSISLPVSALPINCSVTPPIFSVFATSPQVAPVDSTLLFSRYIVLTQLSDGGSNIIPPMNTITLNGFTFSTSVAWGCSNQSTSV